MSIRRCLLVVLCVAVCAVGLGGCFLFPNRPPVAAFVPHYNVVPGDPMVVDLNASISTDPDGDAIVHYQWAFSDDLTIVQPLAHSTTVDHPILRVRCPTEGTYSVVLVVIDERGLASEPFTGVTITVPQPLP